MLGRPRRAYSWPFNSNRNADIKLPDSGSKRKPFSNWVKKIANFKGGDQQRSNGKKGGIPLTSSKHKKSNTDNGTFKNNPYPESGPLKQRDHSPVSTTNGFSTPVSRPQNDSFTSLPISAMQERETQSNSNRSGAPTLATNAGTIHSDAGQSRAATSTTRGGALSTHDGAGAGSTFSSPNGSEHSLTTTLTTIQSQSPGNALGAGASGHPNDHHHGSLNNPNPNVMFSHQYPTSPAPSHMTASAIPRHITESVPNTYNAATANNLLSDNASILTLASSSKRRRRSMDMENASVRALAPSSVWGGSRESLPLSVLSGHTDGPMSAGLYSPPGSRPSISGIASAERASLYSFAAPAIASERNSYYAASHKPKDLADAKSLRSITNIDARSQYDAKSINDAKSMDVASLRNYEGSTRSGAVGHSRNDSIPGSIGSPLASPGLRQPNMTGALSRRSSEWQELDRDGHDDAEEAEESEEPTEVEK